LKGGDYLYGKQEGPDTEEGFTEERFSGKEGSADEEADPE
jgi:hypothetical protein